MALSLSTQKRTQRFVAEPIGKHTECAHTSLARFLSSAKTFQASAGAVPVRAWLLLSSSSFSNCWRDYRVMLDQHLVTEGKNRLTIHISSGIENSVFSPL